MKIYNRLFALFFSATLLCAACSNGNSNLELARSVGTQEIVLNYTEMTDGSGEIPANGYERKLTKNGTIRFETSDTQRTHAAIAKAVSETNGYISSDNKNEYAGRSENTLVIRVPADNFDSLLEKISSNADKIDDKNIEVLDVTQEFIDLDTRINTKKELENRYRELLKRANTVDEILKIEEQIGHLRADIESTEGRLRYLTNQISLSTLTVTFYEKSGSFGFGYKFTRALRNGWNNLLAIFIVIANLWAIILFGIVVWMGIALWLRKRGKRKNRHKAISPQI